MTRGIIKNLFVFAVLAFAISNFSACDRTPSSTAGSENANTSEHSDTAATSTYPPLPAAVSDAEIAKVDGSTVKLADKKGKVVLLNLWATWCKPCRVEMPALVQMQNDLGPDGFEVIGLNADDEEEALIKQFAESQKLNYQLGWMDGKLHKGLLNISRNSGIPQSFLIDREGRLRGVFMGAGADEINLMKRTVAKVVKGEPTEYIQSEAPKEGSVELKEAVN